MGKDLCERTLSFSAVESGKGNNPESMGEKKKREGKGEKKNTARGKF